MAKQRGFRFWTRSIFNIPRWIGWHDLKKNASTISDLYRSLFKSRTVSVFRETFEEAVERMGLSEADIAQVGRMYYVRSLVFAGVFLLGLAYQFFLLSHHYWGAALVMLSIDFMILSFWFREHFWYTQIKHRRLGLTFSQWLKLCFHS